MSRVGVLGSGAAVESIRAAVTDTDATIATVSPNELDAVDLAVAAGTVDGDGVGTVATLAREADTPIVTVELGGIGGRAVAGVDAAVGGFGPLTACYDCLQHRLDAVDADTDDGACDRSTARLAGAVAGRGIVQLLSGGPSRLLGGVVELPYAERQLLAVPDCRCDGDRDRSLRRGAEGRSLEEATASAELAFNDRFGPITTAGELESFPVPYYLATLASTPFSDADVPEHAAGVAAEWDPAFMKALGEALERYSAAVYRRSSFTESPSAPIDPGRVVAPDGFDGEPTRWYPAESLSTGEAVELPAELVVFPPPERTVRPAITTGLGLGNSGVEALVSGLYEVIERDAAMLAWYSSYEPLGIDVDSEGYRTLSRRARSESLEVTSCLLTQDVDVPVVAACVHRNQKWPEFAAGMAADLDASAAATGALEEAIQNWLELRRMGPETASEQSGAIGPYAEFPDAARSFVDPETTVPAATVGPADPVDGDAELEAIVDRVTDAGLDAYGARLTPRDVESLGFEAVRVVVPEAQPLFTDDAYFGERARTVPESLGFDPLPDREHHPFP